MIVEFIGCSGAGKTTLARMLKSSLSSADPVLLATDLVIDRPGRRWISNPTAVNLVADITVLPQVVRSFERNREFARYAANRLRWHAPSAFAKLNYMRNIVRRVGIHELARRRGRHTHILADEGTLLTAYYLFVYSEAPFSHVDLEHFARLVPLPDRVVYVEAPTDELIKRALERHDRRRELTSNNRTELRLWIERARAVFDGLSDIPLIRDRILKVENANGSTESQRLLESEIASFIRKGASAGGPRSSPGSRYAHVRRRHDILGSIKALLEALNERGVRYCHWKSNWALAKSVMARTDLDLLIQVGDTQQFRAVLDELGFAPVVMADGVSRDSAEHYYSFDRASGTIVHVHAYYQIVTGESLAKNYHLPAEEMLLTTTRTEGIVTIPTAGAELMIFVLRMAIKHTTVPELVLLTKQWSAVRQEVNWLLTDEALEEAKELVAAWLPEIEVELFENAHYALKRPAPLVQRVIIGLRLRMQLRKYARRGELRARWIGAKKFLVRMRHRLAKSRRKLMPEAGGALIAFVGSEATGKSTVLGATKSWMGRHYTVRQIHTGKPPSTLLTFIPHALLPLIRKAFPDHRSTHVQARHARTTERQASLLFALRSVMLAYERKQLLARAADWCAGGETVLCDRYPSARGGAPDSPQLPHLPKPTGRRSMIHWLTKLEARLYQEMPIPDLVIYLTAPLEVTIARNESRDKTEAEDYVRVRHALSSNHEYKATRVQRIETDQPLEDTVHQVKEAIWDELLSKRPEPHGSRTSTHQSRA